MKVTIDPPRHVAGTQVRAVVAVDVEATGLPRGGVVGRCEKRAVAIVLGSGEAARLMTLDGTPCDPGALGLTRRDIA